MNHSSKLRGKIYILLFISLIINGCKKQGATFNSISDLNGGKTFAAASGTAADQMILKRFPDAKIIYFNSILDCAIAVKEGKADATAYDKPVLKNIKAKVEGLKLLDELVMDDKYGFAVKLQDTSLKKTMDDVLHELKKDGTYDAMVKRWFPEKGNPGPMPSLDLTGSKGILRFGTAAVTEPMSYVNAERKVVGFDIEFATYIARKLNKNLEIVNMEFGGMIPALISGKVDMIGAGLSITKEREKSVLFSESYYPSGIALMVRDAKGVTEKKKNTKFSTLQDVSDKKVGVLLGSIHEKYAMENQPEAQLFQYQNVSDMLLALKQDKIDAAYYDHVALHQVLKDNHEFDILAKEVFSVPMGAAFNEDNDSLRIKYNLFLKEIKSNGIYDDMVDRWMNMGLTTMPEINQRNKSGELRVGIVSDIGMPSSLIKDGKLVGFDIELSMRFADYIGRKFTPIDIPFGSMIASISTNKIDFGSCSMMITAEREKQVDFSDPYFISGVSVIAKKENIDKSATAKFTCLEDIADKNIGIYTGTVQDEYIAGHYPKAKVQRYNLSSDMILALKAGKIDAIMFDLASVKVMLDKNPDLALLSDNVFTLPVGVGFNKNNPQLKEKFNEFLKAIKENGTFAEMQHRWFEGDAEKVVMPDIKPPGTKKKLVAAVASNDLPYVSLVNGKMVGFDVEMLKRFASYAGYDLKIEILEFSSLVSALSSGKADLIADGICITDERAKVIDFSDPYTDIRSAVVVLRKDMPGGEVTRSRKPFWKSIGESFYSNIILENRYKIILDGLWVTIIISLFSAILGTIIGGLICYLRMSKRKLSSGFARVYISLLRGTPVLVLLMIIFYVIFASVNINPVLISILAFSLNFAAYVSEMFRTSIESIDKGQYEAGIAGGFTKVQTYTSIILPQALRRVIPVYKGEFISLVKMTSIVGYIAVQDITRAGDIIRSRTFDAFFPLIMAAVIYLFLAWILTWALDKIEISVDPKRKKIKKMKEAEL